MMAEVADRQTADVRRVMVLGGGFGGVTVAQTMERLFRDDPSVEITLVSQTNSMLFYPMLAETISASIELSHILSPLRRLCPRTTVRAETIRSIDLTGQTVTTVNPVTRLDQALAYDHLVVALGSTVNFSGLPGVSQHGIPFKTVGDALYLRTHLLEMLDAADVEADPEARARMLTFVVAGGGFSGVEVAAELNDFVRECCGTYRNLRPEHMRVILLHSGERILPELGDDLALHAQKGLQARGVEILLKRRIAAASASEAKLQGGESIPTRTLIVAIGTTPNPVVAALPVEHVRGRLAVDSTLRVKGYANVWALGDCAAVPQPGSNELCPPTAQFALRQGKTVAHNVAAALGRGRARTFDFRGLGVMVSLGRRSAAAQVLGFKLSGFLAWLLWRSFYLSRLPGLDRKLRVLIDWNLDLMFRRDIVQLNEGRTERLATAHYEAGEDIVRQGDPADLFYLILRGEVQVLRREHDVEREVARLSAGESFGEVGLIRQQRRNATVRAVGPVDVVSLEKAEFHILVDHWKQFGETIMRQTTERDVATEAR
ncbi:MAG: FAD-dependent oxidoreductase [Chloroflexi bacterium]|nr:FAD-dependent oxidoreductase [Chloroflexota bacterium]